MSEALRQAGEQLIPAIAYGDAAGLPVETQSADQIRRTYGRINQLLSAKDNPFFSVEQESGAWSDDTQLSVAVSEGLILADGFDLEAQVEPHIKAYEQTPLIMWKHKQQPRGWGASTAESVRRLMTGVSPEEAGAPGGSGNGVLMKMAPLVYWQTVTGANTEQRYAEYDALTRMTHDSDIAVACTRLHGDVLEHLLDLGNGGHESLEELVEFIQERADIHDRTMDVQGELRNAVGFLKDYDLLEPAYILQHTDGKGFYAPQTLAMTYATFIENAPGFHDSVYGAINLGGDTDSTASIVAAMVNFVMAGDFVFPDDALQVRELTRLTRISKDLARTALVKAAG